MWNFYIAKLLAEFWATEYDSNEKILTCNILGEYRLGVSKDYSCHAMS
jgi:hypothetical protein